MSQANINEIITIEEKIKDIKQRTQKYNNLTDDNKIKSIDEYNSILKEKESCLEKLEQYKTILNSIDNINDNSSINDQQNDKEIELLMLKTHEIKNKMKDSNINLNEMVSLLSEMTKVKSRLSICLESKKLEIIKLE
jgi:hypothetical protein